MNKKTIAGFLVLLLLAVFFGSLKTKPIKADVATPLKFAGYAWSGANIGSGNLGGLGWVSFTSNNETGTSSIYGAQLDPTSGDISGSVWSSNYGWLSFDRSITGNPPIDDIGAGTGAIARNVGGNIVGWARFPVACKDNLWDGSKCTGNGAGNKNGVNSATSSTGKYWDGWVSLSKKTGDPVDYGVTYSSTTQVVSGYAWGSNNVGWVKFNLLGNGCTPGATGCVRVVDNDVTATCSVAPANGTIPIGGGSVDATWTATISRGTPNFSYHWSGNDGLSNSGSTAGRTVTINKTYTTSGSKNAFFTIDSDGTGLNSGTIACSNSLAIGDGTVVTPGTCAIPANATLCTGSSLGTSTPDVRNFGSCDSGPSIGMCQFQCADATYVLRSGACVKRTVIDEQ